MIDPVFLFFLVFLVAGTVLANLAVWGQRRLWMRWGAILATAAFLPAAYLSLSDLLSRPKPIWLEWANNDLAEAEVLGSELLEGVAIYVWLAIPNRTAPRAYVLPWDLEMAKQLQDAGRTSEETGAGIMMGKPFEPTRDDQEIIFYAAPQEMLPAKRSDAGGVVRYRRPGGG